MSNVTHWLMAVARACVHVPSWMVVKKERMAMGMAIVAVFGAAAAFCAARSELASSRLESKLRQGQMLELTIRQRILDNFIENDRLRLRREQHYNLGKTNAAANELRAQEEFDIADTLNPFIDFTWVSIQRNLPADEKNQQVDKLVSAELRNLGFYAVWVRPTGESPSNVSIWEKWETQIHDAQDLVTRLTKSVVVFVLALVFFTLAQLSPTHETDAWQLSFSFIRRRNWKLWLTCVGFLIAVGGLLFAGWHDSEAWKTFAKFAAGILAVMGLGRVLSATYADWEFLRNLDKFGPLVLWLENPKRSSSVLLRKVQQAAQWLRNYFLLEETPAEEEPGELEELEPPKSPGLRIPTIIAAHRLGRLVIKLIAATACASAISGLWYSTTIIKSDRAAAKALNYQVERFKTSSLDRMETYALLNQLADGRECLTRLWADEQRVELTKRESKQPTGGTVADKLLNALGEVTVKDTLVDKISGVTVTPELLDILNGYQGPDSDPRFPEQLLQPKLTLESEILFAKGDGENEISLAWRKRAIGFLRSLTLFAIALYLFGQSLGLGRTRAAFMLSLYALALAGWAVISPFNGWRENRPPSESDVLEAATYYGAGRALYETSGTNTAGIKAASWSGQQILFTLTSVPADIVSGSYIFVGGVTPSGYNSSNQFPWQVASVNGLVVAVTAVNNPGPYVSGGTVQTSSLNRAVKEFQRALEKRPTLALAEYYMATSNVILSTPQQQGYISQISKASIPSIVDFRLSAIGAFTKQELSVPVRVLGDYGFESALLGFCQRDRTLGHKCVDRGLQEITQAIHQMKDDADRSKAKIEDDNDYLYVQFNLAWALLADGQASRRQPGEGWHRLFRREWQRQYADEAYRQGTTSLQRLAETNAAEAEQIVAGAISDLSMLERYCNRVRSESDCGGVRDDIALRKKELIAAVWGHPSASDNAEVLPSDVEPVVNPAGLGWSSAKLGSLDLRRHVLDVIWYKCDTANDDPQGCDEEPADTTTPDGYWRAWWVLPGLSKRVTRAQDFAYYTNSIDMPDCLPPGRYLAEFYMDGKLSSRVPADLGGPILKAINSRDLNMSICYPETWKPWKPSNSNTPLVKGYTSGDGSRGAFLFKYYYPMQNRDANVESAISRARNLLVSEKLISNFEPPPVPDRCKTLPEDESTFRARSDRDGDVLLSKAWVQKDGVVHVALVFHRFPDTNGNQNQSSSSRIDEGDCNILSSARNMY